MKTWPSAGKVDNFKPDSEPNSPDPKHTFDISDPTSTCLRWELCNSQRDAADWEAPATRCCELLQLESWRQRQTKQFPMPAKTISRALHLLSLDFTHSFFFSCFVFRRKTQPQPGQFADDHFACPPYLFFY